MGCLPTTFVKLFWSKSLRNRFGIDANSMALAECLKRNVKSGDEHLITGGYPPSQ